MSYLLDTCVLSELMKPAPDSKVAAWVSSQATEDLFISVITLAKMQRGIYQLPVSARRARLQQFLDGIHSRFGQRILSIDNAVAERWARETANVRPLGVLDSLLAATALVHGMTLATRNEKDMPIVTVFNPWTA